MTGIDLLERVDWRNPPELISIEVEKMNNGEMAMAQAIVAILAADDDGEMGENGEFYSRFTPGERKALLHAISWYDWDLD